MILLNGMIGLIIFFFFIFSQIVFWYYTFKSLKKESLQRKAILLLIISFFILIKVFFSQPYFGSEDDDDFYIYERLYLTLFPQTEIDPYLGKASEDPSLINYVIYPFFKLVQSFNPQFRLFPSYITFFTLYSSIVMLFSFYLLIRSLFKEKSLLPVLILILSQNFFYFSRSLSYIFISHCYFLSSLVLLYFFERKKGLKRYLLLLSSVFLMLYSSFIKIDNRIFLLVYVIFWLNMKKISLKKVILYLLPFVPIPFIFPQFFQRAMAYFKSKGLFLAIKDSRFLLFKAPNNYLFLVAFILSFLLFLDNYSLVFYFFTFLVMYSFSYSLDSDIALFRYGNALVVSSLLILTAFLNKEFFKKRKPLKNLIYLILICLQFLSLFSISVDYYKSNCINYLESTSFEGISEVTYFPIIFGSRPFDYALILKSKNPDISIIPLSSLIEKHKISIELSKIYLKDIVIPDACRSIPPEKVSQIFTNLTIEQIRPYCYDFKWKTVKDTFKYYLLSLNKSYPLKEINFLLIRSDSPGFSAFNSHQKLMYVFRSHCSVKPLEFSSRSPIRMYNITC